MSRRLEGWTITYVLTAALAVVALLGLAAYGWTEEGFRFAIRWTGRASTILFSLAFAASALVALWRTDGTAWLRRNRRYVGVSFATSQTIHLMALVALAGDSEAFRQGVELSTLLVGGMAFVFTYAMAFTSSDAAVRAMGGSWHRLHRVGSWWIFAVFAITTLPDATASAPGLVQAVFVVGALALRVGARVRARRLAAA